MNANPSLDDKTLGWLREQMQIACDMADTVETLRQAGFSDPQILGGIEAVRPRGDAIALGVHRPPLIEKAPAKLRKIDTDKVDLYTLDDFLSPKECANIISLVSHHLRPSNLSYDPNDDTFRNSTTADLCHLKSPAAIKLDEKICRTIGIRREYSEGIQAQRYEVGQQFKAHYDYFEPDSAIYRRVCGIRGNRTWTFMVYLNDGMEGGATRFRHLDLAIEPKAGMAVIWNNLTPDGTPNPCSMHAGEPVTRGHKVIITKWFRVHGHGPLFY